MTLSTHTLLLCWIYIQNRLTQTQTHPNTANAMTDADAFKTKIFDTNFLKMNSRVS